jgi:hypothetical protein
MKTTNVYIRKTDASAIEVDSNNRPARSVVAIHRNEPLILAIHVFDGATASTQMTQVQLAAYAAAWNLNIAPSPNMTGPLCLQSTSATVGADGTISVVVDVTDTVQAAAEIGNDTRAIWTAELTGTPGDNEQPNLILQWRIAYINRVASENEPPPEAQTSDFYPKPVIDAKFAAVGNAIPAATTVARGTIQIASADEAAAGLDTGKAIVPATLKTELDKIESTLNIPRDVADLADDDGLLFDGDYNSLTNKPTIPHDVADLTDTTGILSGMLFDGDYNSLTNKPTIPHDVADLTDSGGLIPADLTDLTDNTGILSGKVDVVAGKELSDNNYSDTDLAKVAKIDLETLTELTGDSVTVAPWTQSKWSASGVCSLTASGWAASGHQIAYIVITLAAEATLSISGTEEVAEDDALIAAGVYECYIKNVDGKKYFRVISFTEAAS